MSAPTFGSLFAGIGGIDLGLERAGWTCCWQIEIDPFCQRVLAARWPHVAHWSDVREWQGDGHECPPDLLVGGFPCQDLSVAGKRRGLGGERSGLFWEIIRIAKLLTPAWGLFENVPGLLSSDAGRDFARVLGGLRECWPAVGYRVLDSRHFGVPQRRRRVFLVCGPSEAAVASVLFEPEGGGGHPAAGGEAGARVAHALAAGAGGSKFGSGRDGQDDFIVSAPLSAGSHDQSHTPGRRREDDENLVVAATLKQRGRGATDEVMDNLVVGALGNDKVKGGWRAGPDEAAANQLVVGPLGGGNDGIGRRSEDDSNLVIGTLREHCRPGSNTDMTVVHSLSAEGADASEDGTGRGTPIIPIQYAEQWGRNKRAGTMVRRLTPLECERL